MNFNEQSFNILVCNLTSEESWQEEKWGYVAEDTGLAYFPDLDREGREMYTVTHLASGFEMGASFYSETVAQAFIKQLLALEMDWHQPAKAIFEVPDMKAKFKQALRQAVQGKKSHIVPKDKKYAHPEHSEQLTQLSKEVAGYAI